MILFLLITVLFSFIIPDGSLIDEFYVNRIEASRKAKDKKFSRKRSTPLKNYKDFEGLNYFPVDTNLVILSEVNLLESSDKVNFKTSSGRDRLYLKHAELSFRIADENFALTVYKALNQDTFTPINDYYFIPFTDDSNGDLTYGGGRYLDFNELGKETHLLDFNRAYNPYCAYEDGFSCPIPPKENYLASSIYAGEKTYK